MVGRDISARTCRRLFASASHSDETTQQNRAEFEPFLHLMMMTFITQGGEGHLLPVLSLKPGTNSMRAYNKDPMEGSTPLNGRVLWMGWLRVCMEPRANF